MVKRLYEVVIEDHSVPIVFEQIVSVSSHCAKVDVESFRFEFSEEEV